MLGLIPGAATQKKDLFKELAEVPDDELTGEAFMKALRDSISDELPITALTVMEQRRRLGEKLGEYELSTITQICSTAMEHYTREGNAVSKPEARNRLHGQVREYRRIREFASGEIMSLFHDNIRRYATQAASR